MQGNVTFQGTLNFLTTVLLLAVALYVFLDLAGSRSAASPPETVIALPEDPIALAGTHVQGASVSPVGIIVFSDFECVFCGRFANDTWPTLKEQYLVPGHIRLAFRHAPNPQIHPNAIRLAKAANCAAEEGRFWEAHDLFFEVGTGRALLERFPETVGIDRARYAECMARVSDPRLDEDRRAGARLNVTGTPTFFIGPIVDDAVIVSEVIPGAAPLDSFVRAIERALPVTSSPF